MVLLQSYKAQTDVVLLKSKGGYQISQRSHGTGQRSSPGSRLDPSERGAQRGDGEAGRESRVLRLDTKRGVSSRTFFLSGTITVAMGFLSNFPFLIAGVISDTDYTGRSPPNLPHRQMNTRTRL